jgi:hypothetical protein
MSGTTTTGPRARSLALIASAALLGLGAPGDAHGSAGQTVGRHESAAHTARSLNGTDTAHLHLVRQKEAVLFEEGAAGGALPGRMKATLTVGSVFHGTCTIYTAHGSITGRGTAKPHGTGRYQSFSGTLVVTGGTGLYRHVHGSTGLYGTFDRRTFALVVQTKGRLSY